MRGHKFITIYNIRKPKPAPELHLAGITNTRIHNPITNSELLLKQKRGNRTRTKITSLSVSIKTGPISTTLKRRSSSKNLQVNPDELSSWFY